MKTRYIAGLSLAVMGAGFITTKYALPDSGWVHLLESGFEAGLVGGIADWFAVTALFRHPMGIPIPHTALLLKNRNKIINSLISAMENELLKKESITQKLSDLKLFQGIASGTTRIIRKRKTRVAAIEFAQSAIEQLPLEKISGVIRSLLADYVRQQDIKPMVSKLTDKLITDSWDEKALDYALAQGKQWVSKRETEQLLGNLAHSKLEELQVGGFMGFAVQAFVGFMSPEKLGPMVQNMLLSGIRDLSMPGSQNREKLLHEIRGQVEGLSANEQLMDKMKGWLEAGADSIELEHFIHLRLEELRQLLLDKLEEERLKGGPAIVKGYRYAVEYLRGKQELLDRTEKSILSFIVNLIEKNHYRIGLLVRDNLNKLDDQALVQMLEEKIGSDLQWIRVNGALCGFAVGVVLSFF